jgi:hypothetical protein
MKSLHLSPDPFLLTQHITKGEDNLYIVKFSEEICIAFILPPQQIVLKIATILENADSFQEQWQVYEATCQEYLLQSEVLILDSLPAGIPKSIVELMFHLSGLQETNNSVNYTNEVLGLLRQTVNDPISAMKQMICLVFPGYTFDKLDQLNLNQLYRVYVNAESLALKRGIIEEELKIINKADLQNTNQSVTDLMKESNKELQHVDGFRNRANIKDTAKYQKAYVNTANKFKR